MARNSLLRASGNTGPDRNQGLGIGQTNVEDRAAIRLLADCVSVLEARLPEAADGVGTILGLTLRRVAVTPDSADNVLVALGVSPVKVSG